MFTAPKNNRISKVNSLLLKELGGFLAKELAGENRKSDFLLSITRVETSRDLKNAHVYYLVYPQKFSASAKKFLQEKAYAWQGVLGKKLTLKYKPKLTFVFDKGQENAFLVEEILQKEKIKEEKGKSGRKIEN